MFFVYVYIHPKTNIPFYVSKGTGDRDLYHWWNKANHYNDSLGNILQELHRLNQRPIINRVLVTTQEQEAYDTERQLIIEYGRLDLGTGTLCNKTPGGEGFGNTGTRWSARQRNKIRDRYQVSNKGVGISQYTLEGTLLKTFVCARELKESGYTSTQIMAIRRCCKGQRYSVGGFRWSYVNEPLPKATTTMKKIRQLTKTGEFLAEFVSVAAASNALNINPGDIASVARGNTRLKTAGGFRWEYCD